MYSSRAHPRLNARSVRTTAELFSAADGRVRIPVVMKNVSDSYPCVWLQNFENRLISLLKRAKISDQSRKDWLTM